MTAACSDGSGPFAPKRAWGQWQPLSKMALSSRRSWPWGVVPWCPIRSAPIARCCGAWLGPPIFRRVAFLRLRPLALTARPRWRPCGRWPGTNRAHCGSPTPRSCWLLCSAPACIPVSWPGSAHAMCTVMTAQPVSPSAAPGPARCAVVSPYDVALAQWQSGRAAICSVRAPRCARPRTSSARSVPPWCTTPTRWPSSAGGPGPPSSAPISKRGTALGELCSMAGLESVESLLRYARHVEGAPQSKAALRAAART